ncbi:hypothetical protein SAMN02745166_04332 [Prosthecobacter debontii]|uniref:DUF455 family protein n=1 Tax=Prosthecobacter debontii TaxID=48467 RepID=A0A1T4YV92_9BACT|nr:hypothetical protein [Prosthecobacter debontii]SKB05767.1 hypothetical protein SAMN02745166_04332 [Prosthecobacter debontii]
MTAFSYPTYRNLPPLAGLGSFEEAAKPGLGVEESVDRIKRYHFAFKRLMQILEARLTAEPVYELKMAFSLHAHYCAEHCTSMRERVAEMRTPPLGLEKIPHQHLATFFQEIQNAPTTEELVMGVYEFAFPALLKGLQRHMVETNVLSDHPSVRICRFAALELDEVVTYGRQAVAALVSEERLSAMKPWRDWLRSLLDAAGDLDGSQPQADLSHPEGAPCYSQQPLPYDKLPRRDDRFPDPYNMGVHAEEFLYDPRFQSRDKTLMMYYKRLREIDVPEMMATILTETQDKPWAYYRDMTRQLWDEARHAMMGEVGFVKLGIDWPKQVMVNFTWSLGLNTQLKPWERHAVLYFIEQGLMTKTGKRFEWEVGADSGDELSKVFQDYDWADEVLHARIGRDWYVSAFGDQKEAIDFGSQCWSKVLSNWNAWKEEGKTDHRNWWPGLYASFCERQGIQPDPEALKFATTYEATRADLEKLAASA